MVALPSASELSELEWDTALSSAQGSGDIASFDGSLWFKFEATAGVTYNMYIEKPGNYSNSANSNVYDASGNLAASTTLSRNFKLDAGPGGTYYVQLFDYSGLPGEATLAITSLAAVDKEAGYFTGVTYTGLANERIRTHYGNDTITIGNGVDAITGPGDDYVVGNALANRIWGELGNDYLAGEAGDDVIWGGLGQDRVFGGDNNDQLFGGDGFDRIGGGIGADRLFGGKGADELNGDAGSDILHGGKDGDRLNGGTETDFLYGDEGNDIYVVDDQDTLIELANQGTDTVESSITWTLGDNFEKLILTGTADINGTGNSLANSITGNSGINRIDGKAGADKMTGLGGNDLYTVDRIGDIVVEGANGGTDGVYASNTSYVLGAGVQVEVLATTSGVGTTALNLVGNEFAQAITGNAGVNRLDGKGGADKMTGLGGNDVFVFNSALGGGNIDTVMDFSRAVGNTDKIGLGASVFHQPVGALTAAFFVANASGTAVDGNDRIIYNTTTGALFYDSNGGAAGGATQFGVINGHPSMTASDFIIV